MYTLIFKNILFSSKEADLKSTVNNNHISSVSQIDINIQNSIGSYFKEKGQTNYNQINIINEDEENEETYQNNDTLKNHPKEDNKHTDLVFDKYRPVLYYNKNIELKSKNGNTIFINPANFIFIFFINK